MTLLLAVTLASIASGPVPAPADLVIRHARVYTVDNEHPWAESVAVLGDRIAWVGADSEAAAYIGASTHVVDAGGRLLLPGFIDSHFHALLGGNPDILRIQNNDSLQAIQQQVKDFARQHPKLKWIEVEGWNYSAFPDGSLPTAEDLEAPDGHVTYLDEGEVRAVNRKMVDAHERPYNSPDRAPSNSRHDAEPLVPGKPAELKISMWPTSVLL